MLRHRIVAHRGYQRRYPENTLLSMAEAIAAGARFLETDIQFSRDEEPVLYHDIEMRRISGIENAVHLMDLAALTVTPACEPERLGNAFQSEKIASLAAFAQLLNAHPDVEAFIEVKESAVYLLGPEKVYDKVAATLEPVMDRCILISFSKPFISHCSERGARRFGPVLEDWEDLDSDFIGSLEPEFIFCSTDIVPDDADLNRFTAKLVVYEVDSPEAAKHWFDRGVDLVETFDIGGMLEALGHGAI